MRSQFALIFAAGLVVSGCSINDDLRSFRSTVPNRIAGAPWPALAPLGAFEPLGPPAPAIDARSMAARAVALRAKAAQLRGVPVLEPRRARAMRAALRRYGV